MIKSFLLAGITLLMVFTARAQNKNASDAFIKYYNSGQADSLYALCADEFKQGVSLDKMNLAVRQTKQAYGNLVKDEYAGGDKNMDSYIATFEKPDPVLYLTFNKGNKLMGFFIGPARQKSPVSDPVGTVTVKTASAVLKGTLSVPNAVQKIPVVLLIAGSGPIDRNGNSIGERSNNLSKISDGLILQNIAVLRYDKRGIGQSTTTKATADVIFDDMVDDAVAFIKLLKADKRFSKVIVAGHSEGSLIGMLACERESVDAFISLSGPAVPADVILKTQFKQGGLSADDYQKTTLIIDTVKAGKPIKQKLAPVFANLFSPSLQPYLHSWMLYNPSLEITKLVIPVLIVQGTNDIQVDAANGQQLKNVNLKAQLKLITGMSHILKEAPADRMGNIATYANPDLPLHPQLIPALAMFIKALN